MGECQCLDCADHKVLESIFSDLPAHQHTEGTAAKQGSTQDASNEELISDLEEMHDDRNGIPYDSKFDQMDDLLYAKDFLESMY